MSLAPFAILVLASSLLGLVASIFVAEVLAAVLRPAADEPLPEGPPQSVGVLIPAHNEGPALAATIEDVKAQLAPGDRIIVVADNCTDETAAVARAAGAEVIERNDPQRRGKGYALDFGIEHLSKAPPGMIIIIDADCRLSAGAVDQLARTCERTRRPIQARYVMAAPAESAVDNRFRAFAGRVKNWVRPLGLKVLGLPCQLMGTGMAFPWAVIRNAELASGHIVEDLKLGLELARARHAPLFCPSAIVISEFPSTIHGAETQRQRWEGGHLKTIAADAVPLIFEAIVRRNRDLLVMALDMAVPPLTFLAFLITGTFLLSALGCLLGLSPVPLIMSAASLAGFVVAVALCWLKFGRDLFPLSSLSGFGPFLLNKIRLYAGVLRGRTPSEWTRTERRGSDGKSRL